MLLHLPEMPIVTAAETTTHSTSDEKKWKQVLVDITSIYEKGTFGNQKFNNKNITNWINLGIKVVGEDNMLLDIYKTVLRHGFHNQIAKFCEKLVTNYGCGNGLKFLAPFLQAVNVDSQYRWVNMVRDALAHANWPKIEFQNKQGKHALDAVLATLWVEVYDKDDTFILEWERRQGLDTCSKFLQFLKADDNEDSDSDDSDDIDEEENGVRSMGSTITLKGVAVLEKEHRELKEQMIRLAQENMDLRREMMLERGSIPSTAGTTTTGTSSAVSSFSGGVSFGTFTKEELGSMVGTETTESETEIIGPASVRLYASVVKVKDEDSNKWIHLQRKTNKTSSRGRSKAGSLFSSRASSRASSSRASSSRASSKVRSSKTLQIGDRLVCKVNKSEKYGTFVTWKSPTTRKTVSGLVHRDNYTFELQRRASVDLFAYGHKLTLWFLGWKDDDMKKARLTMIDPHARELENY